MHGPLKDGFDSHLTSNMPEVIVHDQSQILPCYVVHVGNGAPEVLGAMAQMQHAPWEFINAYKQGEQNLHPKLNKKWIAPGDRQREQEQRQLHVRKYFPFGFGLATGKHFVIEEIGTTSDDEEKWGDY